MTINRSFTAMPDVPMNSKLTPWQAEFMRATKQNIDLLTGANGIEHTALIRGDVQADVVDHLGVGVAFDSDDYAKTVTQLTLLTNAVNALITQLN